MPRRGSGDIGHRLENTTRVSDVPAGQDVFHDIVHEGRFIAGTRGPCSQVLSRPSGRTRVARSEAPLRSQRLLAVFEADEP